MAILGAQGLIAAATFAQNSKKIGTLLLFILAQLFGLLDVLHKDYFYASDVSLFFLVFPCHKKCFGRLSRKSSHLHARHCREVTRSRVRSKICFLRCFYLFVLIGGLLEYCRNVLYLWFPQLRMAHCEVPR